MNVQYIPIVLSCLLLAINASASEVDFDISGKSEIELTVYAEEGQFSGQDYIYNGSVAFEPEFYWEWNGGDDSVVFTPFLRGDIQDDERSHGDIRELSWLHVSGDWEFRAGLRKVFWGVTEFNHLVDVINQTDAVESSDGEDKLGQQMLNASTVTDVGIFDVFVLPGFRERTFAGENGRLRSHVVVNTDSALYESGDGDDHVDYALRWSHSINVFDVGAYWFDGTDRQPTLQTQTINGSTVLVPFYQQVTQYGVDIQATVESWLLKFEAIYKESHRSRYAASQAGFEYSFYGVNGSSSDVGLLLEYGWDERGQQADSIAQNDIYLGTRWTLNDAHDSALLMGLSYDADYYSKSLFIEASRRLNDRWTLSLEGVLLESGRSNDPVAALSQDDNLQLTLERYF